MTSTRGHKQNASLSQNHKAQLANAYNELGKELSSTKIRVVGNYTLGRVIGEGAYGKVRMGTHRLTSTRVAIKQIPKAMSASLTREIHHHRQLHHPHITQMYEVIATESHIWIVTELCCGGELFDYLVEKGRLSEDETRIIFGQLCLAVAYLHDNNIVHRDLKLENVLLDERCRVKLGDFGFTREFERGMFMETFCGTTGYASPEMLQGKKYQGPEVDVWSLGVILYCLLTGTLPFDDDDEDMMREKIILGDFEDPNWLSMEARDLIRNVLVKDVANRYMIPQILAHPWFTSDQRTYEPATPEHESRRNSEGTAPDSSEPELELSSAPTTPEEEIDDPFNSSPTDKVNIPRQQSNSTIRKPDLSAKAASKQPATVPEEERERLHSPSPLLWSSSSKAPPSAIRTPARTKRRSVSSILSENGEPTMEKTPTPLPTPSARDLDFAGLLTTNTPVMFSTPNERHLLNTLSMLGFDTAQIVHSVLSHACDSAGAVWWMLRKKEDKVLMDVPDTSAALVQSPGDVETSSIHSLPKKKSKRSKANAGVQTDSGDNVRASGQFVRMGPQLALVPPTPTLARPSTPPRTIGEARTPLLSPSSSTIVSSDARSHPTTPSGSVKEKDKEMILGNGSSSNSGSKGRKNRSGSVSIMQRATTALEAAGLVRKKSSEAFKEKERERSGGSDEREREKSREGERRVPSNEEPRPSHGSGSRVLTKSPPPKVSKDYPPSTPPPSDHGHQQAAQIGSPWVLADGKEASAHAHSHSSSSVVAAHLRGEMQHSHSTPNFTEGASGLETNAATTGSGGKGGAGQQRNKANLLTAFRLWFNEERKGKRKEENAGASKAGASPPPHGSYRMSTGRRGSINNGKFTAGAAHGRGTHRGQRPSMSSRRSSSVNSRRSSGASQLVVMDSPQIPTRRSLGSHTPNSEFGGEHSSRPSSIRSFSMQPPSRHRKSPSQSSAGSIHLRTSSPMQKYHRRAGSGSSTRVVRQAVARPPHVRSNSATSSLHSPPSSRPTSYYEPSEGEGPSGLSANSRTASPYKSRSRRSTDDSSTSRKASASGGQATFVAQKRQGPFASPGYGGGTVGRSSWKKSWGMEPPGWSSRTTHLPIEVLAISPANEPMSIRDVFSGKQINASPGDESDWVDEDDDIPSFVGGLGQVSSMSSITASTAATSTSLSMTSITSMHLQSEQKPLTLSPAPRGHRDRGAKKGNAKSSGNNAERPPAEPSYETEARSGRRGQLPPARSGPAFKQAIQEEDEEEEE